MNRFLMLVAVTVALDVFAPVVCAQSYVVSGYPAPPAEVQLLSPHGARPGNWVVNGSGFVAVDETQAVASVTVHVDDPGCWCDLDVPRCEGPVGLVAAAHAATGSAAAISSRAIRRSSAQSDRLRCGVE